MTILALLARYGFEESGALLKFSDGAALVTKKGLKAEVILAGKKYVIFGDKVFSHEEQRLISDERLFAAILEKELQRNEKNIADLLALINNKDGDKKEDEEKALELLKNVSANQKDLDELCCAAAQRGFVNLVEKLLISGAAVDNLRQPLFLQKSLEKLAGYNFEVGEDFNLPYLRARILFNAKEGRVENHFSVGSVRYCEIGARVQRIDDEKSLNVEELKRLQTNIFSKFAEAKYDRGNHLFQKLKDKVANKGPDKFMWHQYLLSFAREDMVDGARLESMINDNFRIGDADFMRLVIELGVSVNASRDRNGNTTLHIAVHKGWQEMCRVLIDDMVDRKCSLDVENFNKVTPLQFAVAENHDKICEMLLDGGANPKIVDERGNTLLHIAGYSGHENICRFLIRRGADIGARNFSGHDAADAAIEGGIKNAQLIFAEEVVARKTKTAAHSSAVSATELSDSSEDMASVFAVIELSQSEILEKLFSGVPQVEERSAVAASQSSVAAPVALNNDQAKRLLFGMIKSGVTIDRINKVLENQFSVSDINAALVQCAIHNKFQFVAPLFDYVAKRGDDFESDNIMAAVQAAVVHNNGDFFRKFQKYIDDRNENQSRIRRELVDCIQRGSSINEMLPKAITFLTKMDWSLLLQIAAYNDKVQYVEPLLEAGADMDIKSKSMMKSALDLAQEKSGDFYKKLCEYRSRNAQGASVVASSASPTSSPLSATAAAASSSASCSRS